MQYNVTQCNVMQSNVICVSDKLLPRADHILSLHLLLHLRRCHRGEAVREVDQQEAAADRHDGSELPGQANLYSWTHGTGSSPLLLSWTLLTRGAIKVEKM